eukprot:GHRR01024971.1.p1 GENE.GHRR01024971.1~~GHRR01024971.1.p1  ORF type:complete len:278 (+),score=104.36 GHRR01024971.1:801-1634(+)
MSAWCLHEPCPVQHVQSCGAQHCSDCCLRCAAADMQGSIVCDSQLQHVCAFTWWTQTACCAHILRCREFFQCDFDIAGTYASMVPDAEVLKVLVEILTELQLGQFTVKLNHRKLLDAMLAIAGVPAQKFRPICSAIDKLDKEPWEAVRAEMVNEKGLPAEVADTIGQFVVLKGQPREVLATLAAADHPLAQHPHSAAALAELSMLFDFLEAMGALGPISFDLSLARGLDYYTGVIYEAVLEGGNVGSIAAGAWIRLCPASAVLCCRIWLLWLNCQLQ